MILVTGAAGNVGGELVAARAEMSATTPAKYVGAFFDFYVAGALDESKVLPTVREVTGREPRTFAQWAAAHADAFR